MADYNGTISIILEVQDFNSTPSLFRVNLSAPTIDGNAATLGQLMTLIYGGSGGTGKIVNALTGLTNGKITRAGFSAMADFAAPPSSETGKYELVTTKAHATFLDGGIGRQTLSIPAPVDALFLGSGVPGQLSTMTPSVWSTASTIGQALQTAVQAFATAGSFTTLAGGTPLNQFGGGAIRQGHAPRRRHNLGQ